MNSKNTCISNLTIYNEKKNNDCIKPKLKYRCIQILGEGTYGIVYEAIHTSTGIHVALKHSRPEMQLKMTDGLAITAIREIALLRYICNVSYQIQHYPPTLIFILDRYRIVVKDKIFFNLLRELKHPNIVELLDVLHSNNNLFLVFELCDIDLRHYMKRQAELLRAKKNQPNLINKVYLLLKIVQ
jgi:serine/threonine protein kinase